MKLHRRHARGFTLLELVLVMLIMCIAMAMAAPSLRGFASGRNVDDAATQVLALTHWARDKAIVDGRIYRLVIDSRAGTYRLIAQDLGLMQGPGMGQGQVQVAVPVSVQATGSVQGTDQFVELGSEFGRLFVLPEGVEITLERPMKDGADFVEFEPSGRSDPAIIRLIDTRIRQEIVITCLSPTETFHIVGDREGRP